jgi:hypothetical protein
MTVKKEPDHKDDVVKTGPPVDDREDDGRKDDDGTAGPRPQGGKHGDEHEVELKKRAKFLHDNPVHKDK